MSQTILVTGAAGFIGSNFCRFWSQKHPNDTIIAIDALTYAGVRESLQDIEENITFIQADIGDQAKMEEIMQTYAVQTVVNFAAESHNSYALLNPSAFFKTNCLGTQSLCAAALKHNVKRLHHISTCEVYGDLSLESPELFSETSPYRPRTPYNASKAAGDHVVRSYFETFHLPITITNCANNYGAFQFPEKVIPLFICNALQNKPLPVYQSNSNRREWIHVLDHCRAIEAVLERGIVGETYHVGSGVEKTVSDIVEIILTTLGASKDLVQIVPDRAGHDRRYALDFTKITKELGWKPQVDFTVGMQETIDWYIKNEAWWRPLIGRSPVVEGGKL